MAAPTFSTEVSAAGRYPNSRFNARERKLLESVDTHLASGTDTFASKTLTSPVINGTIVSTAADLAWTLEANDATALKIGSAASVDMLVFDTRTAGTGAQLTANVELHVADTTASSSKDTGCIIAEGGVGIEKELYVGLNANIAGQLVAAGTTASTTKDTGAFICEGGVGIEKELFVGLTANVAGVLTAADTTASSSKDTGAIICEGGVGIEKELFVGLTANVAGVLTAADATASSSKDTGAIVCEGGVGIEKELFVGLTANIGGVLTAADVTDATSATAAGTVVSGGLGVAKKCWLADDVTIDNGKKLKLAEATGGGISVVSFTAPALAADVDYTLPSALGGAGTVLTDAAGNGTLSWAAQSFLQTTASGTMSAAAIKGANAAPIELVAAPAAGHVIIVDEIELFLDFATAAHVRDGGNEEIRIRYGTTDTAIHEFANATDAFLVSAADAHRIIKPTIYNAAAVGFDPLTADGESVVFQITNSELGAAGDSPIKYRVKYRDITLQS